MARDILTGEPSEEERLLTSIDNAPTEAWVKKFYQDLARLTREVDSRRVTLQWFSEVLERMERDIHFYHRICELVYADAIPPPGGPITDGPNAPHVLFERTAPPADEEPISPPLNRPPGPEGAAEVPDGPSPAPRSGPDGEHACSHASCGHVNHEENPEPAGPTLRAKSAPLLAPAQPTPPEAGSAN